MMFNKGLVAVIKIGNKILRENQGIVKVPFGSEYSIHLKNLENRKASVNITIDGTSILGENSLIVNPNSSINLERFIINNNLSIGPKFKFIEKTEKISENRGDTIDDGIIRIEYSFEFASNNILIRTNGEVHHHHHHTINPVWIRPNYFHPTFGDNNIYCSQNLSNTNVGSGANTSYGSVRGSESSVKSANCCINNTNGLPLNNIPPQTNDGITVKGNESNQQFQSGFIGMLESCKHVITLQLKGTTDSGEELQTPILVSTKKKCEICGDINPSKNKFCGGCGTNLNW